MRQFTDEEIKNLRGLKLGSIYGHGDNDNYVAVGLFVEEGDRYRICSRQIDKANKYEVDPDRPQLLSTGLEAPFIVIDSFPPDLLKCITPDSDESKGRLRIFNAIHFLTLEEMEEIGFAEPKPHVPKKKIGLLSQLL